MKADTAVRCWALPMEPAQADALEPVQEADQVLPQLLNRDPWPGTVILLDVQTHAGQLLFGVAYRCRWLPGARLEVLQRAVFGGNGLPRQHYRWLRRKARRQAIVLSSKRPSRPTIIPRSKVTHGQRRLLKGLPAWWSQDDCPDLLTRRRFIDWLLSYAYHSPSHKCHVAGWNLPRILAYLGDGVVRKTEPTKKQQWAGAFVVELMPKLPRIVRIKGDLKLRKVRVYPSIKMRAFGAGQRMIGFEGGGRAVDGTRCHSDGRFLQLDRLHSSVKGAIAGLDFEQALAEHHLALPEAGDDLDRLVARLNAQARMLENLRREFDRHPIRSASGSPVLPEHLASATGLGRGYLQRMGIRSILEKQPDFPPRILGASMEAFYGGRTETRLLRVDLPGQFYDFASTYVSLAVLKGAWKYLIAERIGWREATAEVRDLVDGITLDGCFDRSLWSSWGVTLVKVQPKDEWLPCHVHASKVDDDQPEWAATVAPLTTSEPRWFFLDDVIAAKLLGGQAPDILEAVQLFPEGVQDGLETTWLRKKVRVEPAVDDLFAATLRGRVAAKQAGDESLNQALKDLGNGTAYGQNVEFRKRFLPLLSKKTRGRQTVSTAIWTGHECANGEPRIRDLRFVEEPGPYCFPPLGGALTAGARLLLAMVEASVQQKHTERGNAGYRHGWVCCDTDSMFVVSTEKGDDVDMQGKLYPALSWADADAIQRDFDRLRPVDEIDHLLRLEPENSGADGRRTLWCYSVGPKRYRCRTEDGEIVKRSAHTLGNLRDPYGEHVPSSKKRWITEAWDVVTTPSPQRRTLPAYWQDPAERLLPAAPWSQYDSARYGGLPVEDRKLGKVRLPVRPFDAVRHVEALNGQAVAAFEEGALVDEIGHTVNVSTRMDDMYLRGVAAVKSVAQFVEVDFSCAADPLTLDIDGKPVTGATTGPILPTPIQSQVTWRIGKQGDFMEHREMRQSRPEDEDAGAPVVYQHPGDVYERWVLPLLRDMGPARVARDVRSSDRWAKRLCAGERPGKRSEAHIWLAAERYAKEALGSDSPLDGLLACKMVVEGELIGCCVGCGKAERLGKAKYCGECLAQRKREQARLRQQRRRSTSHLSAA